MKRYGATIVVVAIAVILAIAFYPKKDDGGTEETITLGVVMPLTGRAADQGKDILNGIELARNQINAERGKGEPVLRLVIEDNMSTPKGGVSAIEKLLQTERPPVVIGPIASSIMLAMIPVAEREKTVLLSPASSSPKISNSGKYIFRISLLAPPQAEALAEFAKKKLNAKKAAILYINDDTGLSYRDAFKRAFTSRGGSVVYEDSYEKRGTDFRIQLTKLKGTETDVTFVPGIPQTIGLIHRQAKELGLTMQFLGNYGAEGESLLSSGGDAVEGFVYTSIPIAPDFVQRFMSAHGRHPTIGAPLGYDSVTIVWHIAQKAGGNAEAIRAGLGTLRDYRGATGMTTILPSGDAHKEVCLKVIRDGSFVPLGED